MTPEPLRELPDGRLMRRSARGDAEAFRVLFDRKHRQVYRTAYQIVGDPGAAEDVVQETFLALWSHAARYRPRFRLDAWLTRIATNKAIDRYRSERRHPDPLGEGAGGSPEAIDVTGLLEATGESGDASLGARWREIQALWDELAAELPVRQRAAFALREIEGRPAREVAAALECSTSAVRSHVSLARKKLRELISERYPELVDGGSGGD